jgi:hypothetical protein
MQTKMFKTVPEMFGEGLNNKFLFHSHFRLAVGKSKIIQQPIFLLSHIALSYYVTWISVIHLVKMPLTSV